MASRTSSAGDIPISQQHAFLDLAKEFQWQEVQRQVKINPALVGVQPSGREGTKRWSALHQAAFSGNADAVRFLLDHNAPTDAENSDGKTPFDVAKNEKVRSVLTKFMAGGFDDHLPTPLRTSVSSKSMKVMKAMKAMKVMKAMKSKIAKGKRGKASVYKGRFEKTSGGLTKDHLTKSKAGKIVSKRSQAHGKKSYANIKSWVEAFVKARVELGLSGFVAIKKGSLLYTKTMELYKS